MAIQDFNLMSLNGRNGFKLNEDKYDHLSVINSNAGDLNSDGFDDVIIQARTYIPDDADSVSSYVVLGKASGFDLSMNLSALDGTSGFRLEGKNALESYGIAATSIGDINGDGCVDLIVTHDYSSHVVFGKGSGFDAQIDLSSLDGSNGFHLMGEMGTDSSIRIAGAGDVNGDGFDDVIIGAPGAGPDGAGYVIFGKASGFDERLDLSLLDGVNGFRINGDTAAGRLGTLVNAAGDVNGDGFDDVIIDGYVIFGKASGFDDQVNLSLLDGTNGFHMEGMLSHISEITGDGDINGDGFDDVVIGVPEANSSTYSSGSCYVLFGKATGFEAHMDLSDLDGSNGFRLDGEAASDLAGASVSGVGDVNGDGFDDVIIGAPNASTYSWCSGATYIVFGRAAGFDAQIKLASLDAGEVVRLNGENWARNFGQTISTAGDVNGDGYCDVVATAQAYDQNERSPRSYIIFGGSDLTGTLSLSVVEGTNVADHLQGTANAEYFSGGTGDDTLVGGGGVDRFDGGEGDDVIIVTDKGFAVIDGGEGEDTLQMLGSNMHLDLTTRPDLQVHHIETIDLRGDGDNSLTLNASTLPNLSVGYSTNTLTIMGNSGDRVSVIDANWIDKGIVNGYHIYENDTDFSFAQEILRVQEDVKVDFKQGVAFSFSVANLNGSNGFQLDSESDYDLFGSSISNAGDVNGDGFDDVIIAAPWGVASYVVFGKTSGFDASMSLSGLDGSNGFRLIGNIDQVSDAGDVNGDGFDDVIVMSNGDGHVVFGKASGFDGEVDLSNLNGRNGFRLGSENGFFSDSISGAGDFNGDGFADVIISDFSSSYLVFGKASRFDTDLELSSLNGRNGFRLIHDLLSVNVSSAGDINGDGFDDVIIGCSEASYNEVQSGSSYVLFGKKSGFDAAIDLSSLDGRNGFRLDGEGAGDLSGHSVSDAGDVNGDGFDDVIIGAPQAYSNGPSCGASYVVFGKASGFDAHVDLSGLDGSNGFRLDGERFGDESGWSVSSAGDFNGDGYGDLIIGSYAGNDYLPQNYVVFGKPSGFAAQIDLADMVSDEGFRIEFEDRIEFAGLHVSGGGDINGDGLDDLIIGSTEYGLNPENPYNTNYVIFGSRNFSGDGKLLEIKGTDGDDTLKGSEIAEHFIASEGNDNLLGRGGADVFDAGAGDDAIHIGDLTFAAVDGGDGNDALHLVGSDLNLDMTTLGDRIQGIETICLYGRGDNTLTLNADSLLSLSGSTNTLKVHGNSGDHIAVQDSGWVDGGSHGFYHTYAHDDAVLLVGTNVTVEFV